jgi:ribosomal protein S18 acetylase RimI-like enzyme
MKSEVHFRQFRFPDDFIPVVELWAQCGPGVRTVRTDTKQEIKKKFDRDPELFLVAERDGRIVGSEQGGFDGRRGLIYHLAVKENFRNQGIGREILASLERLMVEKGCLRSYLLITKDNPAKEFYER